MEDDIFEMNKIQSSIQGAFALYINKKMNENKTSIKLSF